MVTHVRHMNACANTNAIISATRYQFEIKLPFRNGNVFVLKVLSISFNFKELLISITHAILCTICNQIKRNVSFSPICIYHDSTQLFSHYHIITVQRLHCCLFA